MERHFTVAVFVVREGRVLLLFHRQLQRWLPPGGHLEQGETPDEAARREVMEETGILIKLPQPPAGIVPGGPPQLAMPAGIQLESIGGDHEHIDLIYFAAPVGEGGEPRINGESQRAGWYGPDEWEGLGVDEEIRAWASRALATVSP